MEISFFLVPIHKTMVSLRQKNNLPSIEPETLRYVDNIRQRSHPKPIKSNPHSRNMFSLHFNFIHNLCFSKTLRSFAFSFSCAPTIIFITVFILHDPAFSEIILHFMRIPS
jgi:hypothetical protein